MHLDIHSDVTCQNQAFVAEISYDNIYRKNVTLASI